MALARDERPAVADEEVEIGTALRPEHVHDVELDVTALKGDWRITGRPLNVTGRVITRWNRRRHANTHANVTQQGKKIRAVLGAGPRANS